MRPHVAFSNYRLFQNYAMQKSIDSVVLLQGLSLLILRVPGFINELHGYYCECLHKQTLMVFCAMLKTSLQLSRVSLT